MAGYATLAPALAAGPPGWVVWAVGGTLITIGTIWAAKEVVEYETSRTTTVILPRAITAPRTKTNDCGNKKRYSVRIHAQGTDCGGTPSSTIGAPAINQFGIPVAVAQGLVLSASTWMMLGSRQKKIRELAKAEIEVWMAAGPAVGGRPLGKRSAYATDSSGGKRYDVDIFGDGPSFII